MRVSEIRTGLEMIMNGLVLFTPCTPEESMAKSYVRQGVMRIKHELDKTFAPLLCPECGNEYTGTGCPCYMYGDR